MRSDPTEDAGDIDVGTAAASANARKGRRPRKPMRCELPAELERTELVHLKDVIVRQRGRALVLDGSKVTRVDTSGIELLLSAIKTWTLDARSIVLSNPTEPLKAAIIAIGLDPVSFAIEESAP